ncbi:HVO_2922 family protein [Haloprofundus salinisoli]|uniref:HVO_2922 family protein n=1 Tax=Haloprofundus salinisoli TaxID=2876193 RepID=UPI00295ECF76|nr:HVO_2922 family protein [Haloprofundus salinisoli]
MTDSHVHVSVSVVADGETIGQFDSDSQSAANASMTSEDAGDQSRTESAETTEAVGAPETVETPETDREPDVDGETDTDESEPEAAATFELYRDKADEWRWRLRHRNGNIIADGGEGYSSKSAAKNGIKSVRRNAPGATLLTR